MSLILHIDTATEVCSVSLAEDDREIATIDLDEGYSHAEKLSVLTEMILRDAEVKIAELDAVCVNIGPGSYTGLRIGTATAKGLAYGADIPIIGIPSTEVIANRPELRDVKGLIIPMIDARRMEVYTAVYTQEGEVREKIHARVLDASSFDHYSEPITIAGNGAAKCKELFANREKVLIREDLKSSARGMITPGYRKFKAGKFEDTAYFEPYYLKEFVAIKPKKKF